MLLWVSGGNKITAKSGRPRQKEALRWVFRRISTNIVIVLGAKNSIF